MKKLFSIVGFGCLLFAVAVQSRAQRSGAGSLPFAKGEELVYQAEFKRALLRGVDVGEFRFSAKSVQAKSNGASDPLLLVADVFSRGFFTKLAGFRFHEHVESSVDPEKFSALKTNKLDEQGKRVRISEAVFDYEKRIVTWTERDPNQNQPPRVTLLDFTEPIQDVLSMIYFLRTRNLEVGKSFVNAVRVEPAIFGQDRMIRSDGKLSIWITDDSRHLPVWAQVKLNLGTVDIKLKRINGDQTLARVQQ